MEINRRRFLQVAVAATAASLTGSACIRDSDQDASALARLALLDMLGPERVRDLGVRYRAAVPTERTAPALRAAISGPEPQGLRLPWLSGSSLRQRVRDDFAAGRTVIVNGWVLSATEARQCALYSLASA